MYIRIKVFPGDSCGLKEVCVGVPDSCRELLSTRAENLPLLIAYLMLWHFKDDRPPGGKWLLLLCVFVFLHSPDAVACKPLTSRSGENSSRSEGRH